MAHQPASNNWQTHFSNPVPWLWITSDNMQCQTLSILKINLLKWLHKNPDNDNISIACLSVSFRPWLGKRPPDVSIVASTVSKQLVIVHAEFNFVYFAKNKLIVYLKKHVPFRSFVHIFTVQISKCQCEIIINKEERNLLSSSWAAMFAGSHSRPLRCTRHNCTHHRHSCLIFGININRIPFWFIKSNWNLKKRTSKWHTSCIFKKNRSKLRLIHSRIGK